MLCLALLQPLPQANTLFNIIAALVIKKSKSWICKWYENDSFQFHLQILLSLSHYRSIWRLIWLYCAADKMSVTSSQQVRHSALCHTFVPVAFKVMFGNFYVLWIHTVVILGFELCDAESHVQVSWISSIQLVCKLEFFVPVWMCFVNKPSVIHNYGLWT